MFGETAAHINQRKRIHQKHQPFPHPDPKVRLLDNVVSVVSLVLPLTAIPQLLIIWQTQDASGISILTWSLWLILGFPMLAYAIVHKTKPFIVMYALWIIIEIAVILSALKFS